MTATIALDLSGLDAEITELITDKVDVGTTNAQGILRIKSGAGTTLVDLDLANPAFAAGTGSERNLQGAPLSGTAVAAGTAALAEVLDRDENVVFSGPVTVSGGNGFVELDMVEIEVSDVISVQSGVVQYP